MIGQLLKSIFVVTVGMWFGTHRVDAAPIRVGYSAIGGAMTPLWVTQESEFFKGEGLEVELLYIPGGSVLIQAMLGGDVQFSFGPSIPVINASLRGSDLVLIANTANTMIFSIVVRPDIRRPADLKGKKVGVTRLGGSTEVALDVALKKWGLQKVRDVTLLQTGGMPESVAALSSGALEAAVLSPPSNTRAVHLGMREMVDIGQLGIVYLNSPVSTTRSLIRSNRDLALRFLRAFSRGLHRLRTDKDFSLKVLSKYTKVGDAAILGELYQVYGVKYSGDRIPYVRPDGVDTILKGMESKEAKNARPADFVDNSLLQELEKSGWFRGLSR